MITIIEYKGFGDDKGAKQKVKEIQKVKLVDHLSTKEIQDLLISKCK